MHAPQAVLLVNWIQEPASSVYQHTMGLITPSIGQHAVCVLYV